MFDLSSRQCVAENILTFAVPMKRFEKMIGYMEESFLITETWDTIRKGLKKLNNGSVFQLNPFLSTDLSRQS